MPRPTRLLVALLLASTPLTAGAQRGAPSGGQPGAPTGVERVCDSLAVRLSTLVVNASADAQPAVRAQDDFENFRCRNLPSPFTDTPTKCSERVGQECYWYFEDAAPPPPEPRSIREHRERLISLLDTVATHVPGDRWTAEQRVRYLVEAGRPDSALAAASACRASGWTCDVLIGFSLHALARYAAADSVYRHALAQMSPQDRCDWRSVDALIDDDTRQSYQRLPCGDPRRDAFEDRIWFFARTLYSRDGNDSRTEYYARRTMQLMLRDGPTIAMHADDYLRLELRFGWSRAWTFWQNQQSCQGADCEGFDAGGPGGPGGLGGSGQAGGLAGGRGGAGGAGGGRRLVSISVTRWQLRSYQPTPAYRYVPPGSVLTNPAISDSAQWRLQLPPVIARYAPPYALSLTPLEHQKAMFRRGDTALVVMAYDARATKQLSGGKLTAALMLSPSETPRNFGAMVRDAPKVGVLMARAPWGGLLMSAEVYAPEQHAVARARYGVNPPLAAGTRVTLSDMLFYKPYGTFPTSVEEAAPHALPTERLMANEKLGVYWESYGTDPAGEKMHVSLTVVREVAAGGLFSRLAKSLKMVREATPVVVSVEDLSARGANTTPRALEVDISTLKKGSYIVELEIAPAGQPALRAEHRIEVIGP